MLRSQVRLQQAWSIGSIPDAKEKPCLRGASLVRHVQQVLGQLLHGDDGAFGAGDRHVQSLRLTARCGTYCTAGSAPDKATSLCCHASLEDVARNVTFFLDLQGSVLVLKVSDEPFEFGFLTQGFEVW